MTYRTTVLMSKFSLNIWCHYLKFDWLWIEAWVDGIEDEFRFSGGSV